MTFFIPQATIQTTRKMKTQKFSASWNSKCFSSLNATMPLKNIFRSGLISVSSFRAFSAMKFPSPHSFPSCLCFPKSRVDVKERTNILFSWILATLLSPKSDLRCQTKFHFWSLNKSPIDDETNFYFSRFSRPTTRSAVKYLLTSWDGNFSFMKLSVSRKPKKVCDKQRK